MASPIVFNMNRMRSLFAHLQCMLFQCTRINFTDYITDLASICLLYHQNHLRSTFNKGQLACKITPLCSPWK